MGASSTIKSAERTLDVLQLLSSSLRPVPTMVVVRECGIPKSSAHHLLNVMRGRGWVTYYEEDRAWGLGAAAFETGSAYLRSQPLQRLGRPVLRALTVGTGLTSHLAVLHGADVLYLDKELVAGSALRLVTEVGVRLPAHLTAVGRAILAWLSPAQVRALYPRPVLLRRTEAGPLTIARLLDDLAEVRERGYALEVGLTTPGIGCVAAAALSHEGYPIAAVGLTFDARRHQGAARDELTEVVRAAAERLAVAMGVRRRPTQDPLRAPSPTGETEPAPAPSRRSPGPIRSRPAAGSPARRASMTQRKTASP
jgi:DNA-binding IclR family transcriptional regulator